MNTKPLKSLLYQVNNFLIIWFFMEAILIISLELYNWYEALFLQNEIETGISFLYWRLRFIISLIHILSCVLVYYDAKKIMAGSLSSYRPRYSRTVSWTPFLWAILVFFIPIILFALYLYKRKEIFVANHPGFRIEYKKKKALTETH